jgi:glycogen debranching enzyme
MSENNHKDKSHKENSSLNQEGYEQALSLLKESAKEEGFVASLTDKSNYHRIWSRDGVIIGLAGLASEKENLTHTFKATLKTLADHQGPHGEIPSNVDPSSGRVSYGGTAGRVDANLWFLIGIGEYVKKTEDRDFLENMNEAIQKVRFLLGAWEFNNRGLLYIPQTGDWADEYIQTGYVLYDQLLYYKALRSLGDMYQRLSGKTYFEIQEKADRLRQMIQANYWFDHDEDTDHEAVYHKVLFDKARKAASHRCGSYWMSYFAPQGYGYRFDGFANILVSLFDIATDKQRKITREFIDDKIISPEMPLVPAFYPAIKPVDEDWESLQTTFSYTFKNRPYEYHNSGLWPMLTGFYVIDLVRQNEMQAARKFLGGINKANRLEMEDEPWGFPEYVHGKNFTPGGARRQGWSAAGAILAHTAVEGRPLFDGEEKNEDKE